MKLRIPDLLDDYQEDTLVTQMDTPLSMERIERLTMNAAFPPKEPSKGKRILWKVLVAAATISALAMTTIAQERETTVADWFRPAVEKEIQQEQNVAQLHGQRENREQSQPVAVDPSQIGAINDHGKIVNQSVTKNGATVTLVALYGDEYTLTLYFRVEAPEGTVLPDEGKYRFRQPSASSTPMVKAPEDYEFPGKWYPTPEVMPDEDPTDNKKDFVVTMSHAPDEQGEHTKTWQFHDGVPKTFTIEGLYQDTGYQKVEERYVDTYKTMFTGPFEFDITHTHTVERMEIDVTGCEYSGHVQDGQHPETGEYAVDYPYTVTPVRLALSPFTAEVETRYTVSEAGEYTLLDFELVMKDGTSRKYGYDDFGYGMIDRQAENGQSKYVMHFMTPIDPEQIDYVLIGDLDHGDTVHKVYP